MIQARFDTVLCFHGFIIKDSTKCTNGKCMHVSSNLPQYLYSKWRLSKKFLFRSPAVNILDNMRAIKCSEETCWSNLLNCCPEPPRIFHVLKIHFEATDYILLIDWDTIKITEPPLIKRFGHWSPIGINRKSIIRKCLTRLCYTQSVKHRTVVWSGQVLFIYAFKKILIIIKCDI